MSPHGNCKFTVEKVKGCAMCMCLTTDRNRVHYALIVTLKFHSISLKVLAPTHHSLKQLGEASWPYCPFVIICWTLIIVTLITYILYCKHCSALTNLDKCTGTTDQLSGKQNHTPANYCVLSWHCDRKATDTYTYGY